MAKSHTRYVCQQCGASRSRWSGRCEACGAWNAIVEEGPRDAAPKSVTGHGGHKLDILPLDGAPEASPRRLTGIAEFDRVSGGGLVPGSALLVGGDPGIGKSTLLLQVAAALSQAGESCLYVSGEEAIDQVRMRARRLGLSGSRVGLVAATSVRDVLANLADAPAVLVIDSIQTMYVDTFDSAPGTVSQLRASAEALIRHAKRSGTTLMLVGHVTKEGLIAGPKVLEHMVDTVLYFESEPGHQYRILRAVKNRYGPTDEIGVFEMTDAGLTQVANPSQLFLAERTGEVTGTAVFAGIEGTRPLLVEIQALVSPSPLATPRRAVVGWDGARLAMVLAVLEARCGLALAGQDVYLNIAGGLRVREPAADLAVAAALVSSFCHQALPADMVVFGEIGLGGEVRPVGQAELRLKEAKKLGFASALAPTIRHAGAPAVEVEEIAHLSDLLARFQGAPLRRPRAADA